MNALMLAAEQIEGVEATRTGLFPDLMWLVPLLPALSFLVILFFGKRFPDKGHGVGILAIGIAFFLSLAGFIDLITGAETVEKHWVWFELETLELTFGMNYDFLTGLMFVVVTFISLLVQIYSTGYMLDDERYTWFYAALSLFTASMLLLVTADNLIMMLVGWEGVGLCSYFLIGHYWEEKPNSSAAIKAFITTRVGDVGFMFGIFALFILAGTFNITEINHLAEEGEIAGAGLTIAALLLFCGAIGKSAQFPLHVWLPDAMAGPTPVSALIHAATMVVAGIYLVARLFPVFEFASGGVPLEVVGVIAAITMLIAAFLALIQDDIKRVLAYSTISQLAYMFAGLAVGVFTAGMFHLLTHAVFKALLFLGAGSVIHAVHSNNMSDMGGLRKYMPATFRTYIIGSLALAGIFPLAGFFSKDEIIGGALRAGIDGTRATAWIVFGSALITAFITALYSARMCIKTFWGEYRGHGHPHESPGSMTSPLWVLGGLTLVVGFLGFPVIGVFKYWIFAEGEVAHGFEPLYNVVLPVITVGGALIAFFLAYKWFYRNEWRFDFRKTSFGWMYGFAERKYYLDDLYLGGIVKPIQYPLAAAAYWANQHVIDGIVDGTARGTVGAASGTYRADQGVVDFGVNGAAGLTNFSGGLLRYIQSGNVQRYAAVLFASVAVFVAVFAFA
ncbi:MAG: NADH-quinone oxidoreductase subunit L [Actinobacteria bacterium]|nr:NADH-quinone oxidoreductase subunit L [Actinomycetota bacterium]